MQFVMLTNICFVTNQICDILWCCFIFVIYISIGFIVCIFSVHLHSTKKNFPALFTRNIIFNGSLKIIFNKRNTCLNLITNFLSNTKIFFEGIQIFNCFLHMIDFGHVGELLKKKELYLVRWNFLIQNTNNTYVDPDIAF